MKPLPDHPAAAVRQAADARLKAEVAPGRRLSELELLALQHQLEARQLELEIQAEGLRAARAELEADRHQAEARRRAALAEAESFRTALDGVQACVYLKDTQSRYTYGNRPTLALFGRSAEALAGSTDAQFFPPDTVLRLREIDARVFRGEQTVEEIDIPDAIGGRRVYWEVKTPIYADAGRKTVCGLLGISTDITERKRTEMALQRSECALRAMSACGQALVHAATEAELLARICRAIVELGGYCLAWVGFPEHNEAKTFRVAAVAGHEAGYLAEVKISWSETEERGRGPTGRAFRTGQRIICQDLQTEPMFAPWRKEAARRGYASSIALPLRDAANTFGIVMIYAAEKNAFQPADVALLTAMSEDLAYGLQALRTRLQHQQAEAALAASETRFRAIFHSNAVGTAILAPDSTISLVNDMYCQLTGYSRPELMGTSWHRYVAPEDLERLNEYNRRRLRHEPEIPAQYEFRFIHKNGEVRHCQIAVALIPSSGQIVASLLDVTERQQSMLRLQETAAQLVDAQKIASLGSYVFEVTTGQWTCSEILGELFGLEDGDFTKDVAGWLELVHPEERAELHQYLQEQVLKNRVPFDRHYRIVRRNDQQERWVHGRGKLILDDQGRVVKMVGVIQDLTERRQLENQMQQAQKMEAIGTLAGGIAHDFNNMLGAMFGYAHLLQQDTEGNSLAQESVAEILKAANRAKELVQQILTFSRQREQKPEVLKLNSIVKEAIKFLRASLPAHIKIEIALADEAPPVLADPTQIYQVTMNLATNALHAMEDGPGQLTVQLDPFQPEAPLLLAHPELKPIPYARLSVTDTGCGMDAKTLKRIFDPFFTTKPVGKGTGLGLAVVHGILEAHHGVITVESQVGQGTTFRLYFPAETKAATSRPAVAGVIPRGRSQRVLVLDDETALTTVLQVMLRRLDYQVTTSNHPLAAIRLFCENPAGFDLVITDLTMPELNGLQVAQQLRANRPDLPVILVSGHGASAEVDDLRAAGICERLDKPVSLATLAEAVARALKPKSDLNG